MAGQNGPAAIRDSSERLWEWLRDLMDLYVVDTGDPDPLVFPPWSELSESSRAMFILASGKAAEVLVVACTLLPEVR